MATSVPTTVSGLLAKVTQSTANIAAHRAAMAEVAAQVKANAAAPALGGGEQK